MELLSLDVSFDSSLDDPSVAEDEGYEAACLLFVCLLFDIELEMLSLDVSFDSSLDDPPVVKDDVVFLSSLKLDDDSLVIEEGASEAFEASLLLSTDSIGTEPGTGLLLSLTAITFWIQAFIPSASLPSGRFTSKKSHASVLDGSSFAHFERKHAVEGCELVGLLLFPLVSGGSDEDPDRDPSEGFELLPVGLFELLPEMKAAVGGFISPCRCSSWLLFTPSARSFESLMFAPSEDFSLSLASSAAFVSGWLCRLRKFSFETASLQKEQYRNLTPLFLHAEKLQIKGSPCLISAGISKYAVWRQEKSLRC